MKTKFKDKDFHKSTFCGIGPCVEVAGKNNVIAVRNSKDSEKITVYFTKAEWNAFKKGMNAGEFD